MRRFCYFSNFTVQTFIENSIKKIEKHLKPWKQINRPKCLLKQVGLSVFAAQLLEGEGIVSACICYCTNSHGRRLDADAIAAAEPNSWSEMAIIQPDYCEPLRYQQASIDD